MKVYRIHFPRDVTALPEALRVANRTLRQELLKQFGGFTSWNADGAWIDPRSGEKFIEPVTVYEIAAGEAEASIRRLAETAGRIAGERAVYIVCDGVASIIDI